MKTKYISYPLISILAALFSGCAFTVHDVEINPAYTAAVPRSLEEASSSTIRVGDIEDRRSNAGSERMIFQQTNLNGDRTSGGWQAQSRIVDILEESISDGLKKAELKVVSDTGDLEISGELVDLDYKIITGFWKGQLNSQMTVKLELKRSSNGEILWRETYFSKDSTDKFEIEEVFQRLIADFVTQIIQDDFLRQTLQKNS